MPRRRSGFEYPQDSLQQSSGSKGSHRSKFTFSARAPGGQLQGAATQAMADIVEDPELRSGRAPPGCDPQAARLVASSSHCPYFTPSIVAPLLMRFQVWLRSGAHMCMNIRPRKPDDANSMPSPLTRAAGEKVAYIKQLLTRGGKFESCESCRQNGIEREKVRNSNATSIFIERQSRNQKKTSACELIGGQVWSSAFRLHCA